MSNENHSQNALSSLVPESDFARTIGISIRTLQKWRQQRKGPSPVRIGRQVYFSRESINKWIDTNEGF
jgi:predicted DNA-binding transcriptional regulator AlpA